MCQCREVGQCPGLGGSVTGATLGLDDGKGDINAAEKVTRAVMLKRDALSGCPG